MKYGTGMDGAWAIGADLASGESNIRELEARSVQEKERNFEFRDFQKEKMKEK